jgi:hypothetical protein
MRQLYRVLQLVLLGLEFIYMSALYAIYSWRPADASSQWLDRKPPLTQRAIHDWETADSVVNN